MISNCGIILKTEATIPESPQMAPSLLLCSSFLQPKYPHFIAEPEFRLQDPLGNAESSSDFYALAD